MHIPITFGVEFPDEIGDLVARIVRQNTEIIRRLGETDVRLVRIERAINANTVNDIITREALMADFTDLTAEVEANGDAVDSAVTLLNALSAQLVDAADDPAEIRAIAEELSGNSNRLAQAVAANTPAGPEPTPEPAPEGPGV